MAKKQRSRRTTAFLTVGIVGAVVIAGGAVAGVISSRAQNNQADGDRTSNGVTTGGTVTYAVEARPTTANPQLGGAWYLSNAYQTYLQRNFDGTYSPSLLAGYEVANNVDYTFHIRDGITFHDGEPLNSDAVVLNFQKNQDPTYQTRVPKGLSNVKEIKAVDSQTFTISLSEPDGLLLDYLAGYSASPISPKSFDASDLASGGPGVAGTGPFAVEEFVPNQILRLKKNNDYNWAPENAQHQGSAYLDAVVVKFVPENATRVGDLQSGQVDAIEGVPALQYDSLSSDSSLQIQTAFNPGRPYGIIYNVAKSPTDDVRVRKAIRDGFDLDAVLQTVHQGHRQRAYYFEPPVSFSYTDQFDGSWGKNLDEANALLDEAGWTGRDAEGYRTNSAGARLTVQGYIDSQYLRDSRDVLQQSIGGELKKNLGVDWKIDVVDVGTGQSSRAQGLHNIFENSYASTDFASSIEWWTPENTTAHSNIADPRYQEIYKEYRATTDQGKRTSLAHELYQSLVLDNAYYLPLYYVQQDIASHTYLHGLSIDEGQGRPGSAYDVWRDQ